VVDRMLIELMTIAILASRGYANDRLQAEILEREKSEQILRSIVEGTVSVTGKDFFRSLVRSLAQALGVRYAFIAARAGAEMERLQMEKALARLAEIGELAATIVHEVRNPLTTIMMALNAFKKLQLADRFQEYLNLSLDEADRLERLLSQILLYSRPQTLDRSHIELNSFIAETLNILQTIPVAAGKHLNFSANTTPVNILADRDKLKQVLINLITNACEAVSIGDAISISLQKSENRRICISIHNGGTPISADILPQLTKPFFTTKASGTGLGLAIVKRIVEAHDGELVIESSEGIGSIVKVQLPLMLY
jgi:two-component system, sporulation sensor kinase A